MSTDLDQEFLLPRTGAAPLKIRGTRIAHATGQHYNAKPAKPNPDWYEIAIYRLAVSEATPTFAVAVTYHKDLAHKQAENHDVQLTSDPAAVLTDYDPVRVIIGYPPDQRFAAQQQHLETNCRRQYQHLVSEALATFPEEAAALSEPPLTLEQASDQQLLAELKRRGIG
jgi:hypothetical protein